MSRSAWSGLADASETASTGTWLARPPAYLGPAAGIWLGCAVPAGTVELPPDVRLEVDPRGGDP